MDERLRELAREEGALARARSLAERRRRGLDAYALARRYTFARVRLRDATGRYFLDFLSFDDFIRGMCLCALVHGPGRRPVHLEPIALATIGLRWCLEDFFLGVYGAAGRGRLRLLASRLTLEVY